MVKSNSITASSMRHWPAATKHHRHRIARIHDRPPNGHPQQCLAFIAQPPPGPNFCSVAAPRRISARPLARPTESQNTGVTGHAGRIGYVHDFHRTNPEFETIATAKHFTIGAAAAAALPTVSSPPLAYKHACCSAKACFAFATRPTYSGRTKALAGSTPTIHIPRACPLRVGNPPHLLPRKCFKPQYLQSLA